MNQFDSIEGKILFLIYQLYNQNEISVEQRGELKDFLISKSNHRFMSAVNTYKKSNNTEQFVKFLVDYVQQDYSCIDVLSIESQKSIKSQQQQASSVYERQQSNSTDTNTHFINVNTPISERRTINDLNTRMIRRIGKKCLTQMYSK